MTQATPSRRGDGMNGSLTGTFPEARPGRARHPPVCWPSPPRVAGTAGSARRRRATAQWPELSANAHEDTRRRSCHGEICLVCDASVSVTTAAHSLREAEVRPCGAGSRYARHRPWRRSDSRRLPRAVRCVQGRLSLIRCEAGRRWHPRRPPTIGYRGGTRRQGTVRGALRWRLGTVDSHSRFRGEGKAGDTFLGGRGHGVAHGCACGSSVAWSRFAGLTSCRWSRPAPNRAHKIVSPRNARSLRYFFT